MSEKVTAFISWLERDGDRTEWLAIPPTVERPYPALAPCLSWGGKELTLTSLTLLAQKWLQDMRVNEMTPYKLAFETAEEIRCGRG